MKIMPTLEGGLRIDAEDATDWLVLNGIAEDAISSDEKLAHRMGELVADEELAADWQEFVVPELEESFHSDVLHVATAVSSARVETGDGPGPLWIKHDDGLHWYSALNQARLALEERFHFGPGETLELASLPPDRRAAFLRSQFYCAIQSLLLEHVMR